MIDFEVGFVLLQREGAGTLGRTREKMELSLEASLPERQGEARAVLGVAEFVPGVEGSGLVWLERQMVGEPGEETRHSPWFRCKRREAGGLIGLEGVIFEERT